MREVGRLQPVVVMLEVPEVPLLDGNIEIAPLEITADAVSCDALTNDFVTCPAQLAEQFLDIAAVMFRDRVLAGDAADELAAIAAGRAPADATRLDDVHLVAALGEAERS